MNSRPLSLIIVLLAPVTPLNSLDINECMYKSVCGRNATCINLSGSYNCICNEGFRGDGIKCEGKVP